jgi:hypothetical protein
MKRIESVFAVLRRKVSVGSPTPGRMAIGFVSGRIQLGTIPWANYYRKEGKFQEHLVIKTTRNNLLSSRNRCCGSIRDDGSMRLLMSCNHYSQFVRIVNKVWKAEVVGWVESSACCGVIEEIKPLETQH